MSLPDFLVIGAQKAGTTWLERNLAAHPQVFSPGRKELHYFDKAENYRLGPAWYEGWFAGKAAGQICGEYTPNYLWDPEDPAEREESGHSFGIPQRAREQNPDLRWIAILRDPVERAVSAYYHHIRAGRVRPGDNISDVWHRFGIRSMGLYERQLRPWMDAFDPDQGLILVFEEDLLQNADPTLRRIYTFLGIDPDVVALDPEKTHNKGNSHFLLHINHRLPLLGRVIQKLDRSFGQNWKRFHIPVHEDERRALREFYAQPNRDLQARLHRPLPW